MPMKKRNSALWLLACAALIVIVFLIQPTISDAPSDAVLIEKTYQAWEKTTEAKDIQSWSSYLAPDAFFMPPDAPLLDTRDAILDYYRKAFADPNFSLDCEQLIVDVAESGDMAWSSGLCRATFSDLGGQEATGTSRWFKIWLKQADGSWKCRVNNWSYVDPE